MFPNSPKYPVLDHNISKLDRRCNLLLQTRTIPHPQLEFNAVAYLHAIPKGVCNRTQENKSISRQPICLTDYDYDYILEEISR